MAVAGEDNPGFLAALGVPALEVTVVVAAFLPPPSSISVVNVAWLQPWPGAPVERLEQFGGGVGANATSKTGVALSVPWTMEVEM